MDARFHSEYKHRPWPAIYRNPSRVPSVCYRPMPLDALTQWITPRLPPHPDYNYVPAMRANKNRDYYYLTPMYRNGAPPSPAMPLQPPPLALASRMMIMDKSRSKTKSSSNGRSSVPPCTCSVGRTRSLEDVRSEVSEWEEFNDENGNRVKNSKNCFRNSRRSMENLLEVEDQCGRKKDGTGSRERREGKNECSRRRGSYMVITGLGVFRGIESPKKISWTRGRCPQLDASSSETQAHTHWFKGGGVHCGGNILGGNMSQNCDLVTVHRKLYSPSKSLY